MSYGAPTSYDPTEVMGRRIVAWFIDIFIPLVIAFAIGWVVFVGGATRQANVSSDFCTGYRLEHADTACITVGNDAYTAPSSDAHHAFTVGGLIYLVGAANLFLLQGFTGAALGKHMLGLRVVRADGSIAGFGWNALRTVLLVVDQFFCALPGLITSLVTHPHRRIGDFAAGTFVVARESVGRPVGTPSAAYPPPWAPPGGPVGWGPPPASGQPWGAPASNPGWGTDAPGGGAVAAPPASHAPPTWGTPAVSPPPAQAPAAWGTPQPAPQPQPEPQPAAVQPTPVTETPAPEPAATSPAPDSAATDAPGWAAPTSTESSAPAPAPMTEPAPQAQPHAQPEPQPAQAAHAAQPAAREPQWDAQRNAWVFWEAETNRWLQHDPATGAWGPLR